LDNWRSTIRGEVAVHPAYMDLESWRGRETADIVYTDTNSYLTRMLIRRGYLEDLWIEAEPEYFIEVKTTTGSCDDRFFMSDNQYRMVRGEILTEYMNDSQILTNNYYVQMQRMTLTPGEISERIYVVFRVFDLGKESMNVKIYVDPEAHRLRNALLFESQAWTVRPIT